MNLSIAESRLNNAPTAKPWALPMQGLSLFYGCPEMPRLSHYFLPRLLLADKRVLYLDGANQISPLLISRSARQRGLEPSAFNRLIRVSRAFTCFQLMELIVRIPKFLTTFHADLIIVTALPDLFFDEDVRELQAQASFQHALEGFEALAQLPISIAIFSNATSFKTQRMNFFHKLCKQADHVVKVEARPENKLAFTSKKSARLLSQ
jgi:hypothetical protein